MTTTRSTSEQHPIIVYDPSAEPLSKEDLKNFESPPYDGSLDYDVIVEKEALAEFVSRFLQTSDWTTCKTYFYAMDSKLK